MEKTIEIPFGAKDSELKGWEYTIPEGMEAEQAALKAYPEKWFRDIDGDSYDCNRCERCAFQEGYEQAEKDLTPLINRLCEAILFEWKDAAELARKTLTQIKARKE